MWQAKHDSENVVSYRRGGAGARRQWRKCRRQRSKLVSSISSWRNDWCGEEMQHHRRGEEASANAVNEEEGNERNYGSN